MCQVGQALDEFVVKLTPKGLLSNGIAVLALYANERLLGDGIAVLALYANERRQIAVEGKIEQINRIP